MFTAGDRREAIIICVASVVATQGQVFSTLDFKCWCLCLSSVLNRTSLEQVRPVVGDRDEVPRTGVRTKRDSHWWYLCGRACSCTVRPRLRCLGVNSGLCLFLGGVREVPEPSHTSTAIRFGTNPRHKHEQCKFANGGTCVVGFVHDSCSSEEFGC